MADLWRAKGDQFFDSNGDPLNGGKFYYFDAGTTDERTVYQDDGAATPWSQPITLDSAGRLTASIYIPTGDFKEQLTNSSAVSIFTEDDIPGAITIPDSDYARPQTPVITKAANYTVQAADLGSQFDLNATGGAFTLTLISAATAGDGSIIWVRSTGTTDGGIVTIAAAGAQTINGASSITLTHQYAGAKLTSDGSNWSAISTDSSAYAVLAKTTTYTVAISDYGKLIDADASSSGFTITLPAVATAGSGFIIAFKKTDSTVNAVTIDGNSSETIDGSTTIALTTPYASVLLRCDGTEWHVEQAHGWMGDQVLSRPEIKDYAETVNAIGSIGGGTQDIDLTLGNVVTGTVDTSETTFTFSNPSATGKACSFTMILTNGGSQTVNFPASVDWPAGTAPTLTSSGVDVLTFFTIDAGTIWYGFPAGLGMA